MRRIALGMLSGLVCLATIASGCRTIGELGSDNEKPNDRISEVASNDRPEPDSDRVAEQHGPYYELLTLESSEVEALIGKPSSVSEVGTLGGNHSWTYEDLGLRLSITTLRLSNQEIVTTLYQFRGLVVGGLSIGDPEDRVTAVAGPITVTSGGDRIAQLVAENSVFTLYIDQGRLVKVRIEPLGREG